MVGAGLYAELSPNKSAVTQNEQIPVYVLVCKQSIGRRFLENTGHENS
jgi:hypothetical protein